MIKNQYTCFLQGKVMRSWVLVLAAMLLATNLVARSQHRLTVTLKNEKLVKLFQIIQQETNYQFIYNNEDLGKAPLINVHAVGRTVEELLTECFKYTPLQYRIRDNTIIVFKPAVPKQQEITGRVTDAQGNPLPGVTVSVKGTTAATTTNEEGTYRIAVSQSDAALVFTIIGYETRELAVGTAAVVNATLQESVSDLDEVVVIGYGTQRRSEITGAISSISGEEINRVTAGGFQEALQGKIAGVNITPTSGQPGGALDMNIRGVTTFGNGNPLFVIDGIPVLTEGSSRNFNPLASLNPENIESMQILKDASASAIYGARAANGVVIITTNRGKAGATQVQFKATAGFSDVTKFLPLMNSAQYIDYATEAYQNAGRTIPVSLVEPLKSKNLQTNTDWQEEGFKRAASQNYWLSISGGNESSNYSFSLGYLGQDGTLPNSSYDRYSARINSDFKIGKRVRVGETVELSRNKWTGTFNQASYTIRQLLQQSPTVPVYDPDALGGYDGPRLEYSPVGRQNTIGTLALTDSRNSDNKVMGNTYVEVDILPGLTNRFSAGGEMTFNNVFEFIPTYRMGDRVNNMALLNEDNGSNSSYIIENVLTYKKTFNEVHDLTVVAGLSQQKSWIKNIGVAVRDFPNNDLRTIGASFENMNITGNETSWALRSQLGRVSYSYKQRYNLMATVRRDGSSRFGKNNRYGVFPSVSGSWILKRENFLENVNAISGLTLRASHGQVGSQEISNFAQYAVVERAVNYVFGIDQSLSSGSAYLSMGNPNLKWEVTTQTNIGLDAGFLDNRLSLVMDYYIKNTDDILLRLPVPTTSGIRRNEGAFVNAGSLQNKGFELTATYRDRINDFEYSLSGNFATNKNRITSLNAGKPIIAQLNSGKQSALTITQEGGEVGAFYGYIMEGIFQDWDEVNGHASQSGSAPGDIKYRDLDGNNVIDANDQTTIGSPFPNFTYGFNFNFLYKAFDLSIALNGKQGHQLYNLIWSDLNEGEGDNNATTEMLNRWSVANPNTVIPRAVTGNPGQNTRPSTRFLEDGSFLRIQNVQLGYDLKDALKRWNASLRIYIAANNLATFTNYKGYNPEIGLLTEGSRSSLTRGIDFGMYPIPRTFEAGLQLGF
ncbi:TonB-dependent receptor [Parapedobacter lycopersici]|uniref:TonB-dependent receptor n=1 Tax=Parapedobacter lycopersici TaxID=1864939 RepID=UPI00214D6AD6|nr:TonB-dependent receptor [Parapedobacter lycopersici]